MEPQNSRLTQSFVIKDGGKENRDLERRNKREKIGGRRKFKKRKRDEEEATKIPFPTGVLSRLFGLQHACGLDRRRGIHLTGVREVEGKERERKKRSR